MNSARLALLGLLPLSFALANTLINWHLGISANSLWLCHMSNLALGLGLLFRRPALVRLATLNLLAGCALWLRFATIMGQATWISAVAHLGGATIGLFATARLRAGRAAWVHAFFFMVAVQTVCYLWTPLYANVNLSHRFFGALLGKPVAPGQPRWHSFLIEVSYGLGLLLINRLLMDAFPPDDNPLDADPAPPTE